MVAIIFSPTVPGRISSDHITILTFIRDHRFVGNSCKQCLKLIIICIYLILNYSFKYWIKNHNNWTALLTITIIIIERKEREKTKTKNVHKRVNQCRYFCYLAWKYSFKNPKTSLEHKSKLINDFYFS